MYEIIAYGNYSPTLQDHMVYFDSIGLELSRIREFIEDTGFEVIINSMRCQGHSMMDDYQFLFTSSEELTLFKMYFKIA